ncbi:hypothetical protein GCM10009682_38310 [Luedemannella flava]|uniref:Uncharacterized protein n=1 Tax=Luedemannella flava TaxID=349316 RepID=A0ABN2M7W2_9ACTN
MGRVAAGTYHRVIDLQAPFTGTPFMPDKEFLVEGSPVMLADGRTVATIRWHTWSERFEVFDAVGALVAECRPHGIIRRQYPVVTPDGRLVVSVRPGGWRPINGAEVTLGSGGTVTIRQTSAWSDRTFEFADGGGPLGRITPTTGTGRNSLAGPGRGSHQPDTRLH